MVVKHDTSEACGPKDCRTLEWPCHAWDFAHERREVVEDGQLQGPYEDYGDFPSDEEHDGAHYRVVSRVLERAVVDVEALRFRQVGVAETVMTAGESEDCRANPPKAGRNDGENVVEEEAFSRTQAERGPPDGGRCGNEKFGNDLDDRAGSSSIHDGSSSCWKRRIDG